MSEWYEESFGEDYLLVYKHRDFQGAAHEVQTMISWLDLPRQSHILDLCCGMGRHALVLADEGYKVTGVDLSEVLLHEAHELDTEDRVLWYKADMRRIPLADGEFDGVLNLFTSFGYFWNDEEQERVLCEIHRILKPGGKYVIDFLNPSYVESTLVPQSEREDEGHFIRETRIIEDGFVKKNIVITDKDGGSERNYHERVKMYIYKDFITMLANAGLAIDYIHGGYNEEQYKEEESERMIFVGHRPVK